MSQTPRVLVVEDDQDMAISLGLLLGAAGYEVETVSDGATALKAVQQFHPDICLIDVNVPVMSGYDLVRRLKEELESPPLLANVTPFSERDDWDAEFDIDFTKPSDPFAIVEQLKDFLQGPKMRTQVRKSEHAPRMPRFENAAYR